MERARVEPVRQYNLGMRVQTGTWSDDYSADLLGARVISSITTPYPIVILDMFITPEEILTGNISPTSEIDFRINLSGDEPTMEPITKDSTIFKLMFLKSSLQAAPAEMIGTDAGRRLKDRCQISLICLCKDAFQTSTGLVNWVYTDTTVQEIIEDITLNRLPKRVERLDLDTTDINTERIDQFVVPPMPYYKFLQYLDSTFGIYNGIPGFHISHDNIVSITNLSKVINKDQVITVWQLPLDDPAGAKQVEELCGDGKNFYTYAPIKSENNTNTRFSSVATDLKYIVKPRDKLFHTIELKLGDIASDFGIIYRNNEIDVNKSVSRVKYLTDHTGFDISKTFAEARTAKPIFNLSTTSVFIERNLIIENLLKVGKVVKVSTKNYQYADLAGKYLFKALDIKFIKDSSWNAVARLDLVRTSTKTSWSS